MRRFLHSFSKLNKGVAMVKEGVRRLHGRTYYDHYWYFKAK